MANRLPYLLTLLAGLFICCCFIAAKAPTAAARQYDYVTIIQDGEILKISSPPGHFEQPRTKMDKKGYDGNFSLLFAKVNEYEAQGYELFENNVFAAGSNGFLSNYALLRRPKQ